MDEDEQRVLRSAEFNLSSQWKGTYTPNLLR
jgi:hypothetical protein